MKQESFDFRLKRRADDKRKYISFVIIFLSFMLKILISDLKTLFIICWSLKAWVKRLLVHKIRQKCTEKCPAHESTIQRNLILCFFAPHIISLFLQRKRWRINNCHMLRKRIVLEPMPSKWKVRYTLHHKNDYLAKIGVFFLRKRRMQTFIKKKGIFGFVDGKSLYSPI